MSSGSKGFAFNLLLYGPTTLLPAGQVHMYFSDHKLVADAAEQTNSSD